MKSSDQGDAELIEAIRQRQPDALSVVYDRYAAVAYSLFLRITRDPSVSEDLLQELFMRVWNRGRDFDAQKGSLGVWIVAIARNMAIDHIRSRQARFQTRVRPIETVDLVNVPANRGSRTESIINARRSIAAAFSSLNHNEKRVLEMAYFEGCSQTEIASRLKEPLGTVKSWARSGLGRLRSILKEGAAK